MMYVWPSLRMGALSLVVEGTYGWRLVRELEAIFEWKKKFVKGIGMRVIDRLENF